MTDVMINSCKASAEEMGLKHDDNRLPFQIFPDPCDSYEGQCKLKDRLPSIVVEPTDVSEVESGELRWPPEEFLMAEQGGEGEGLVPQAGERVQADTEPVTGGVKTQENVEPGQSLSSDPQLPSNALIQPGQTLAK
ncbi:protein LBH-like [Stegostoma tigrinum]|uniref:protein LBH-like n=1 Tax=Stegostoma tigrinum TaxID=3053191 RepID=UPI00202B0898|nr:protein LBH-like [Stegostoma tigrinum]XP_048380839.1 protein LBH-like [Stegostoma tigrinum]XP_048380840.1 protein LBH-like [Stegostoma tigrinum]XP_048380841.1 protein LBH-like [Stegostoma tigrinum]XP_048380842.1 protein LBH-like [Stegostoma tigrinum]XP_048380843.1 protein LBH-like [Stegostoma tigrinum]XP_048380844.1 protein LBH-like [Stegostoma tigrinum]XP_048380845.1 protein LBH-like [Stegostoma tigrinum]